MRSLGTTFIFPSDDISKNISAFLNNSRTFPLDFKTLGPARATFCVDHVIDWFHHIVAAHILNRLINEGILDHHEAIPYIEQIKAIPLHKHDQIVDLLNRILSRCGQQSQFRDWFKLIQVSNVERYSYNAHSEVINAQSHIEVKELDYHSRFFIPNPIMTHSDGFGHVVETQTQHSTQQMFYDRSGNLQETLQCHSIVPNLLSPPVIEPTPTPKQLNKFTVSLQFYSLRDKLLKGSPVALDIAWVICQYAASFHKIVTCEPPYCCVIPGFLTRTPKSKINKNLLTSETAECDAPPENTI